ncbi:MAG: aminotransferase class IV [Bacteroidota bacterium]
MSLLFEAIRLQDGVFHNLDFHASRMNQSRKTLFGSADFIDPTQLLAIPSGCEKGIFKCKIIYGAQVTEILFQPYTPRTIQTLKLVEDTSITYNHKFTDRERLNILFEKRGAFDEILIVKEGLITDTSFSNILFYNGIQWFTPSTPLLRGTMQSALLSRKLIFEKPIRPEDLKNFRHARLVNAMLPFETAKDIPITSIYFT